MGGMSMWHWIIVLVIVMVLFGGAGRIPRFMGDLAKGIKSFKEGMKDHDTAAAEEAAKRVESGATIEGKATHSEAPKV
jgi:sec-independent protein translocase protein TatA